MVTNDFMQTDLSVLGMYQHADIVVKIVMIGLLLASVVTWAIFSASLLNSAQQDAGLKQSKSPERRQHLTAGSNCI